MLPIAPPPFPKSLQYMVTRLANVSRRKVRLTELSATQANPNGLITVTLPAEVIDLDSFQWYGKITTTSTAGVCAPYSADLLIQDYTVSAGGQVLNSVFDYPQLHFLMDQYTLGDKTSIRNMNSTLFAYSSTLGVPQAPLNNLTAKPFCVSSWLGLLGSIQPRVLDLSLLGKTQLTIRLASTDVLASGSVAVTGANYSISDIAFEVDVLGFDELYYKTLQAHLQSGGVLECPFSNVLSFATSSADLKGASQQFTVASQSVDALISTYRKTANIGSKTFSTVVYNSEHFDRGSSGFSSLRISVNNVPMPMYGGVDAVRCAQSVIDNIAHGAQDTLGSCTRSLVSLDSFVAGHFAHALRLNHVDGAYGNRMISGMNTLNNPATVQITYDGTTGTAITPMAFVLTTATLVIGQMKQVEARF